MDYDDWLDKPQKLVKLFFHDGRSTIVELGMQIYCPTNPFTYRPLEVKDGALIINLDLGTSLHFDYTGKEVKISRRRE